MIVFPQSLSADSIAEFHHQLSHYLKTQPMDAIEFDCSGIERVTSSHINLLWQARIRCNETETEIRLNSPTGDLIRVLKALDLYEIFITEDENGIDEKDDFGNSPVDFSERVFNMDFKPETESIDDALAEFRLFLKEININGTSAFELETAFYEVATNIRLHGELLDDDTVQFVATCLPDRLSMQFVDSGQPFDFGDKDREFNPRTAMNEGKKRGFGLIMINRMTDNVQYERKDKRFNILTLEKMWGGLNE